MKIIKYETINSTNDEAKKLVNSIKENMAVIITNHQTNGRGQFQRKWYGEKNKNIYMSLIAKEISKKIDISNISVEVGEIVKGTLEQFGVVSKVKPPNDIYINDKKVAGILVETSYNPNLEYIIFGIGINVEQLKFPIEISDIATSLHLENYKVKKEELFEKILENLVKYLKD